MTDYRILEAKHHAPFIGAFHEWNYWLLDIADGVVFGVQAIYAPTSGGRHHWMTIEEADELYQEWVNDIRSDGFPFDEATIYEIDDKLDGKLPGNMTPIFHQFFNGGYDGDPVRKIGIKFFWRCVHGGELTSDFPMVDVGTHGAGGTATDTDGWVCEEHEGEYTLEVTVDNTREVLRTSFSQYFVDEEIPSDDTVYKIVEWMIVNDNFDTRGDGYGNYPRDEQVKLALEALGYHELEEAE